MNEWDIFKTLATILSSFFAAYYFFQKRDDRNTKMIKESMEATRKNTEQLIIFNSNHEHMRELDAKRDKLIDELVIGHNAHDQRIFRLELYNGFVKEYTQEDGM
mgnify:CR=1 FL=1